MTREDLTVTPKVAAGVVVLTISPSRDAKKTVGFQSSTKLGKNITCTNI